MTSPSAAQAEPSLFHRLRWIIYAAWVIAAIRLGLEARGKDEGIFAQTGQLQWMNDWASVNYFMPLLILIGSIVGTFRGMSWKRLMKAVFLLAALCWCVPNTIAYTTGQFMGWQHGRYRGEDMVVTKDGTLVPVSKVPGALDKAPVVEGQPIPPAADAPLVLTRRAAPLGTTFGEKLLGGLMPGVLTGIIGIIVVFVFIHLFVWIPSKLRSRA